MFDLELYIRGAEEIDRERRIITRLINSLRYSLAKYSERWDAFTVLIEVSLGNYGNFQLMVDAETATGEKSIKVVLSKVLFPRSDNFDSIPHTIIRALYLRLPEIVQAADKIAPEASILEHLGFFVNLGKEIQQ